MKNNDYFPFSLDTIELKGSYYTDRAYSQKHAHTLHDHKDVVELLYVYSGEGRYQVGGREYAISEGDMIICNANILHGETLSLKNDIQTYCIALGGVYLPALPDNHLLPVSHRPVISLNRFRNLIHIAMPTIHQMFLQEEKGLERQLALSILTMTYQELVNQEQDDSNARQQKNETMIREITSYLDNNYDKPIRMEDICEKFHLSRTYLSALFKRETGLSPKQYILLRRLGEAQNRLVDNCDPISKIEEELGFSGSCHFSNTFKKYVGISPREYRKHFSRTGD